MAETETAMVVAEAQSVVDAASATAMVDEASRIATKLATVIEQKKLANQIGNNSYVRCEGWTTLGAMMRVYPFIEWTRPIEGGWEARCLVKRVDGTVLGAAEAQCGPGEPVWQGRSDNARRSMAQTRATGKAMRVVFSWVMTLAGYEATPYEEMEDAVPVARPVRRTAAKPKPPAGTPATDDQELGKLRFEVRKGLWREFDDDEQRAHWLEQFAPSGVVGSNISLERLTREDAEKALAELATYEQAAPEEEA